MDDHYATDPDADSLRIARGNLQTAVAEHVEDLLEDEQDNRLADERMTSGEPSIPVTLDELMAMPVLTGGHHEP